jgi:hypothetical protein
MQGKRSACRWAVPTLLGINCRAEALGRRQNTLVRHTPREIQAVKIIAMIRRSAFVAAVACLSSCEQPTAPTSLPIGPKAPIAGAHTGPVAIDYAAANIVPGSTIAGCGQTIAGCAGRLQLSFRLRSAAAGPVLWTGATLHGANKMACLSAVGEAFSLAANSIVMLDLSFDQFNPACALPFDATDMAVTIEGTIEVASRQEFAIRYRFAP